MVAMQLQKYMCTDLGVGFFKEFFSLHSFYMSILNHFICFLKNLDKNLWLCAVFFGREIRYWGGTCMKTIIMQAYTKEANQHCFSLMNNEIFNCIQSAKSTTNNQGLTRHHFVLNCNLFRTATLMNYMQMQTLKTTSSHIVFLVCLFGQFTRRWSNFRHDKIFIRFNKDC